MNAIAPVRAWFGLGKFKGMMMTLYLRLPSRALAPDFKSWTQLPTAFVQADTNARVMKTGHASAESLAAMLAATRQVVLLLGVADVTIVRITAPPLPKSQVRLALAGLTEDYLLSDPADCLFKSGPAKEGQRTIAMTDRDWLEAVVAHFYTLGAADITALPMPLCIRPVDGGILAVVSHTADKVEIALRTGPGEAVGFTSCPHDPRSCESEVITLLLKIANDRPLSMVVPAERLDAYLYAQHSIAGDANLVELREDDWQCWFDSTAKADFDFVPELRSDHVKPSAVKGRRTPILIVSFILLIHLIGLNIDWWRMHREEQFLRMSMTSQYQRSFPNETVILDPLAQMQQKKQRTQGAGSDQFSTLLAHFSDALQSSDGQAALASPIWSLDYRDAVLRIQLKAGISLPLDKIRDALKLHQIDLIEQPPQEGRMVWQIRTAP